MDLILDTHSELYPLNLNDKFYLSLTNTLSLDGAPEEENFYDNSDKRPSLLDKYEYAMQGKLFRYKADDKDKQAKV
jgi:DNA-directed RNA polymerase I, II, and III subunit RPABC3